MSQTWLIRTIILEGVDGSGKSFLAVQLRIKYGYEIVKTGPPRINEDVTLSYIQTLQNAIDGPPTILDRLHLGEAIYGPLLRGVDRMGADGLAHIERIIADNGVRLIICCPPWDVLVEGWRSKDDLLKDEAQLRIVRDKYLEHAARLSIKPYDWTAADAKETLKGLIET